MTAARCLAAAVSFLLGAGTVVCLAPARRYLLEQFLQAEAYFSSPVDAPDKRLRIRRDTNGKGDFGASRNGGRKHRGIDLSAAVGDPIFASKSGRVQYAGWQKGFGGVVKLDHPDETTTVYGHLSRVSVRTGQWVERAAPIGRVGKSGNASDLQTNPHVHFEIRREDRALDPTRNRMDPSLQLI